MRHAARSVGGTREQDAAISRCYAFVARLVRLSFVDPNMTMNLQAMRAKQTFEEKTFPAKLKRLREITNPDLAVEIDWSDFNNKEDITMIGNGFFDRLVSDLEKLCRDKVGKDAFNQRVKKIVVKCVASKAEKRFALEGDTLVAWGAWGKSEGYIGYDEYRKFLEQNL